MKITSGKRALDKIYRRRYRYEIPDWQRGEVWDLGKKQELIDSILRGWKLPKFYFLKVAEDQYEVVDGQQRLTSIFEFFDGELRLAPATAERVGAEFYDELPTKIGDNFDDFEIEFDEIEDVSEAELKQFFQRLQQGLPLTTSERLNAVHSKLRDYCKKLAQHPFFKHKVSVANTRFAHFDVVAKVAAVEIEGLSTGLRYDDIKAIFESNSSFAASSAVGRRLKATFDYLDRVFPEKSPLLKNRTIVLAFAVLIARIIATERADGYESKIRKFFENFLKEMAAQAELGPAATDIDYLRFQKSISANVKGGAQIRQEVLLRKLLTNEPELASIFDPTVVLESGLNGRIKELGESIISLIGAANSAFSLTHGEDLFKATNKTAQALTRLGKAAKDFREYQSLIDDLYFIFHESIGSRLDGIKPQSFTEINLLRTELQHDLDHGDKGKIRAKRKKIGSVFSKYSGVTSPQILAPERFTVVQAKLLAELEADIRSLITKL